MVDKRAYFKMDVGYLSNPKVLSVLDESTDAVLLHIASIAYASQHLTDGVVPVKAMLRLTGASQEDADLLLQAGLWVEGSSGKAEVHDYLQHQRSAAEVKGASEAGKRAAQAKWDALRNADGNADRMPDAEGPASESAIPREKREREEKNNKSAPAARDDVTRICNHLADRIEANGAKRPTVGKGWLDAARLMIDNDSRAEHQIHAAIDWCQDSEFWRGNVLSMPKLREKYEQLRLQAARDGNNVLQLRPERPEGIPEDAIMLPPIPKKGFFDQ